MAKEMTELLARWVEIARLSSQSAEIDLIFNPNKKSSESVQMILLVVDDQDLIYSNEF